MTDQTASMPGPTGEQAMSRLADRLASLAPPPPALELSRTQAVSMPRQSPAVASALSTSAKISARAAERARRSRSVMGLTVDGFIAACAFIPYALVALALRLVIARVFFLDGQSRVEGIRFPLTWRDLDFSMVLPLQVKAEAVTAFITQVPQMPLPPVIAAWLVAGAEFVLPILLVLGFATRFSALALLGLTVVFQLFLMPQALWTAHVYWASILLVLISLGPGQVSLDAIVRFLARR
jgi:putative oxidoreductase